MTAIGVDIGGTKIAAGLVAADGTVVEARTAATPLTGAAAILESVTRLGRGLLDVAASRGIDVGAVGIGTAGQVDHERGRITYANENLPGWTGTPVAERVTDALGLPVRVENDVRAMAIGESRLGAGRGFRHVLYVAIGTGIGGAIVLDGEIRRGASGTAGECGYVLGGWDGDRPLKVEEMLAGPALAARYREITGAREASSLNEVARRAGAGDPVADQVIREGARRLAAVEDAREPRDAPRQDDSPPVRAPQRRPLLVSRRGREDGRSSGSPSHDPLSALLALYGPAGASIVCTGVGAAAAARASRSNFR